ncbi:hypothetical protein MTR67_047363 [Solanum verrucosum]|uniref:Uncharacterized protein n=1 Tax=Solanum verrucosum TaxID=315347 RepID=A0AAF0UVR6_SOLVR|nr:uncharacterized protein LOC125809367 [Solanum verrucosum]WMV53978.1 hypothetical protein MTR67_047363 [Solanum verrucosum]
MAPSPPQDDFSFPTITNTPPRFLESPPLWRTTSVASSRVQKNPDHEENLDMSPLISNKSNYINQRKSFSHIEGVVAMKRMIEDEDEDEEEEKMDMLWENLNEEMSNKIMTKTSCGKNTKKVEYKCVKSLNLSKASKRPSLVVLIKVLKKVFL